MKVPHVLVEEANPKSYRLPEQPYWTNNEYSDFALLSLNEDPKNLSGYDPYYLGWDQNNVFKFHRSCRYPPPKW